MQRDSAEPASHIEHAVVRFQVGDGSHILEMTASERFEFLPADEIQGAGRNRVPPAMGIEPEQPFARAPGTHELLFPYSPRA